LIKSTSNYIVIDNNATSEAIFNRLGTLLEATSDMCYVYDRNGYLTYVNRNLLDALGYSAEDALGRHCLDFTPADCHPAQRRELKIRLQENRPGQHETHVIDKNGQVHLIRITALPMVENNQVSGGIALATDITRQRLLEDELMVIQQKYSKIFQCSPQFLIISRLEDGVILEVNDSALGICGYKREEAIGSSTLDHNFWVDQDERKLAVDLLQKGIPLRNHEFRFRDRNGNVHSALWSADTMELESKTCIVSIVVDITSKIQTEKALQSFKEKTAQAERMGSLGALFAGVVHEITQPINALKVLTNALLYNTKTELSLPTERLLLYLGEIDSEIMYLENIISHMRSLSQAHNPNALEDCDINQSIRNSLCLLERQLSSHGIRLQKSLGRSLPKVRANSQSLEIVFINLVVNAMESLDTTDRLDKTIKISTMAGPDSVIAQVSDNGGGISPDHLNKIFQPLYTTKKNGTNMGLGLSIIRTIISSIGGDLRCWNDDSRGATFHVEIPLSG